jgi:alpha-galactosidase
VGGNAWRTTDDIRDTWESMTTIGFAQGELAPFAAPGHWNDPDMLEIGNGGMTNDEYRTHMSLWSMLAAPLLAGNDLRTMSPAILEILTNREIIAVNQDKAGKQTQRNSKSGEQEIWARPLFDGGQAIGLFNRSGSAAKITVRWSDIGLKHTPGHARDLWAHQDVKLEGVEYSATVPPHGVVMLRVDK